jgi:hypothetical protein
MEIIHPVFYDLASELEILGARPVRSTKNEIPFRHTKKICRFLWGQIALEVFHVHDNTRHP